MKILHDDLICAKIWKGRAKTAGNHAVQVFAPTPVMSPIGVCIFIQASELRSLGINPERAERVQYNLVNIAGETLIRITRPNDQEQSDANPQRTVD